MRLISQNGITDTPYEMSIIHVSDNAIMLYSVGNLTNGNVIARYSTPKKAQKAMKMLHGFYVRSQCNNRIFHFPSDEDMEE